MPEKCRNPALIVILASCGFSMVLPVAAQQITRAVFGMGYYIQTNTNFPGTPSAYRTGYSGPFERFTFNVNRSIALEASAFESTNLLASDNKVGGHQLLVLGGVKAGIHRRYLGVFGRLDTGAASYSRGLELLQVQNGQILYPPHYYRETASHSNPELPWRRISRSALSCGSMSTRT